MAQAGDAREKGRILTMYSVQAVLALCTRNLVVRMSVLAEMEKIRAIFGWVAVGLATQSSPVASIEWCCGFGPCIV